MNVALVRERALHTMNRPGETFKRLWRGLTAVGWKARMPTGLSVDYKYIKPGVTGQLDVTKKGVDFFVEPTPIQDNTELPILEATEFSIPEPTEYVHRSCIREGEVEQKNEIKLNEDDPVRLFDSEAFLEALRCEIWFDVTAPDDINKSSDGESENVMADSNMVDDDGVESDYENVTLSDSEDEVEPTFRATKDEMRELTSSGWKVYGADHSGNLVLYRICQMTPLLFCIC
ncbi:hypothetical protein PHPALM_92 [Phytophthora palmivora]|uniref:Uncharacterized protein n=1 Tax=Phytophthora palmivora TaxID=4796 RepID=A0A2P4YVV1_9STRA|nr:hypothetical protein PHPALM_92 [Phytophthora palmivora]